MTQPGIRRATNGGHGRRIAAGASAAAAIAVAVAACSSAPAHTTSAAGSAGASSGPSAVSVVVGNAAATYAEAPFVVSEKNGALAAHGVTAKDTLLSSSNTLLAALVSGGVDFGVTDSFAVLAARAKGVPVVAVCGLDKGFPTSRWSSGPA